MAPLYNFSIGTTLVGITNVESLSTPVVPPKSTFRLYAEQRPLSSSGVRGLGFPQATWKWALITRPQRDMLRTFCPGSSANVFIRTMTNDSADSFKYYSAVMVWPIASEELDFTRRINLEIQFRGLVEVTP